MLVLAYALLFVVQAQAQVVYQESVLRVSTRPIIHDFVASSQVPRVSLPATINNEELIDVDRQRAGLFSDMHYGEFRFAKDFDVDYGLMNGQWRYPYP